MIAKQACKPSSVLDRTAVYGHSLRPASGQAVTIYLGWQLPTTSSDQPEDRPGVLFVLLFGLAPDGVCPADRSPGRWWALTSPFHPWSAL